MNNLVIDVDGTLCPVDPSIPYSDLPIFEDMVQLLRRYKDEGWRIILFTSRNMRTFEGSIGKINAKTLPELVEWLQRNKIPYDEIHVGKPWAGDRGFYVDDRAVRPSEFRSKSIDELMHLLSIEAR